MLKTKKLNAVIALEIILSLTLYYFVLIGFTAISYAIDLVQTNNYNIDFSAYFINENGEKTSVKEKSINENEYLYVDIMVKNEGYFNGYIGLNNNNFNIVNAIQSDNIDEISGNTVKLKQINSGETQTIKLLIEPVKDDLINRTSFNANTGVVLSGDYVNSRNIETNNSTQINGTTEVNMLWKSSEDISSELEAEVLTNSIYDLNGEQKRIIQLLINSRIRNNEYPVDKTSIKINGFQNAEQIKVLARNTEATNNQLIFTDNNYEYDKTNNIININVDNNNSDSISWKKDCTDTFVVTYVLDKEAIITNQNILINSNILTYDQKSLESNKNIIVNEEKDCIVTSDLMVKENPIYKGKLYTGEDRTYQTETKVYMNYVDLTDKVIVDEKVSKYVQNETEIDANIVYKTTTISKNNFISILGENGYITIKDENGTLIGNINSNIDTDENGNLILNYNTEAKGLVIETSKPIKDGTLNFVHTKTIKNAELTRDVINNLTGIKESLDIKYNEKDINGSNTRIIELRNTSSKAKLEVEPTNLTATQKNENVKMTVLLENSNEARDLYQNPVIKIKLPSQIKNIGAKCKAMYNNGLNITNAKVYKENDSFIIEIDSQGTQTTYNTNIVEGTSIIIYADIEIDENAENSNEEITMTYTNELATTFEDNGEEKVGIQIEGISEEVKAELEKQRIKEQEEKEAERVRALEAQGKLSSTLKAYVGGQELTSGDTVYTGEIIKYEITLENKTGADINNATIQANIPDGTTLVEYVKNSKREETDAGIFVGEDYYKELNNSGSITKENVIIKNGETKKVYYEVRVNDEATNLNNELKVQFNGMEKTDAITNRAEKSTSSINVYRLARPEFDYILDGDVLAYRVEIKNTTQRALSNYRIKILTNSNYTIRNIIEENNTGENIDYNNGIVINEIPAGETKRYVVNVIQNKVEETSKISAIINDMYHSNIVEENSKRVKINAKMNSSTTEKLKVGNSIIYNIEVENVGDFQLNQLNISQLISGYLDIEEVKINNQQLDFNTDTYYSDIFEGLNNSDEINNQEQDNNSLDNYILSYTYNGTINIGEKLNIFVKANVSDITHNDEISIKSLAKVNDENTEIVAHTLLGTSEEEVLDDEENYHYDNLNYEDDEPVINEEISESQQTDDDNNSNNEDNSNNNNNETSNNSENQDKTNNSDNTADESTNKKYQISGKVWLDENENGQRDSNEKDVRDVEMILLNLETNETQRMSNYSTYQFTNLNKGKYIVIFEYDTNKYNLTKYQAENVSKELNSDVERNKIIFEGKEQILAITDVLNITNEDITNIDLGLVQAKNFDLELRKSVSKITISNTEGTTVKEYNDSALAKVEIGAKYLKNSTVVIEYSIKVKNAGEMAGYAKQIVDYKPTDLKFNSSLNSSWYQSGEYLYSKALEKTKIEPGETKELKLILTKEMTETNTGLTNNMAEIKESSSVNNTGDSDSTQGNKKSGEDDLGQANVIIGVKTGAAISYVVITLSIIMLISASALYLYKKLEKTN